MSSQGVNPQREIDKKSSFGFDVKEYYSIVRGEIEHEDDLINYRLTWLTYTQAILFAAFFAIGVAGHQSSEVLRRAYRMLPIIGFLSVCLILIGVLLAIYAVRCLRSKFEAIQRSSGEQRVFPELVVKRLTHWLGFVPPVGICIIFLWAWISLGHTVTLANNTLATQAATSLDPPCSAPTATVEKQLVHPELSKTAPTRKR